MTAQMIDGAAIAKRINEELRHEVEAHRAAGTVPHLAGVLVGDNAAALSFAENQRKACERIGIEHHLVHLKGRPTLDDLEATIRDLANDDSVSGIVLHRPLPDYLEGDHVPTLVPSHRDVEGTHPENLGRLVYRSGGLPPCTAMAAVEMIRSTGVPLEGKEAVVVGHSEIVGKPVALWLLNRLATTTVCHHGTRDLAAHTRRAEILVVAVGKPGLIRGDMVREGAIVIDVGINRVEVERADGTTRKRIVGDVDEASVAPIASQLSPVPGGVGPVTIAMLLRNTVKAAGKRAERRAPR